MCCNTKDIIYSMFVCVCVCMRACVCVRLHACMSISISQQLGKNDTSPEATANTTDSGKEKDFKTFKEDVSGEYVKCKIVIAALSVCIGLINQTASL